MTKECRERVLERWVIGIEMKQRQVDPATAWAHQHVELVERELGFDSGIDGGRGQAEERQSELSGFIEWIVESNSPSECAAIRVEPIAPHAM